ncbi:hypothetical protein L1887_09264 [Cichorium endivia]|nr:hypothetical protein L1887_09264 [Cichorium endivia]
MAEALDTASRVLAQQYSIKLRESWDSWEWPDEELWDWDLLTVYTLPLLRNLGQECRSRSHILNFKNFEPIP